MSRMSQIAGIAIERRSAEDELRDSYVRRLDSEGEVRNVEYLLRRKDGSMLVIVDNGRVVRDREGRISGFEGTITDITERKKAETAVFQAKERAQVTLQSI